MNHSAISDYESLFTSIAKQLQNDIGYRLFTVSYDIANEKIVERIYSSSPDLYPIGGRLSSDEDNDWQRTIHRGDCFIANQPSEFGEHFTNLDAIVAQGFGAVINMPVIIDGVLMGTLNLLDQTNAYVEKEKVIQALSDAMPLAQQGYLAYQEHLNK